MEKVFLRLGSSIGLATLVLTAALTVVAQAQLPPDPVDIGLPPTPKPIGLPPDPVDIGLPPTPKPIGLPPDPVDIGLPRFPAPMGSSPVPATVELPPAPKSLKSHGARAQECESNRLATVKTDTLSDGRIKIPVNVEGRPLFFMVDTGGTETTIKWEQAKELGLAPKQTSQKLLGVAGSMMNAYVTSSNFSLGELNIKNLPIYVEARNLAEADGTLAPDVMRDYDVDIDFARNSLSLISQDHCPGQAVDRTPTGSIVIPMAVTGDGHVRFLVKIDGQDIMATLDTGSVISFISMRATALLGIDPKAPELRLVRDTGTYQVSTYPFKSLDFGRVSVRNPPIAIFSDNFAKGLGSDLILGTDVLRHMHLYIAYGEKRLYITAAQAN
jgi:predicted aspartyl protease